MQAKIVYAGVNNTSFEVGSQDLKELAELTVSAKQVERVTRRIGGERCAERDREVQAFQALPLTQKYEAPAEVSGPELAVVMVDGGRLQIRQEDAAAAEANSDETTPAADENHGRHWREDKIGLLMTMKSKVVAEDPCPEIPENFVDPTRILKLARELKKGVAAPEDGVAESEEPALVEEVLAESQPAVWKPPEVLEKRMTASRKTWPEFAPQLAQAARTWGFPAATRKAFVGDGSDNNWTIQKRFFSSFVPILDFIHALSYVFAAAMAGRSFAEGWKCYVTWIEWVWQGRVEKVIAALAERQIELGAPLADEPETSPRQTVANALGYLQNHKDKMRYDDYRRQGLPITSSYVESLVKQFNQRVKGTEKFWSEDGAEAILQLRADHLSDEKPLPAFWQRRQAAATGKRAYRRAG